MINVMKWDNRFLEMARLVSTWSKDPNTKVGAVIVDQDKRVISTGYNGVCKHVDDNFEKYNRPDKYDYILHAEENAIVFAKRDLTGCVLYTTHFPCVHCASLIIQSDIEEVISLKTDREWVEKSRELLQEGMVGVEVYSGFTSIGDQT